jgi:aminoglycoside phosphotransferase (APT) family kinase protein
VWEVGPAEVAAATRLRQWADGAGPRLAASGPTTLLHGDFQRRNWLRSDGDVRLVDWELAGLGPGVLDLYFLDPDGPGAGHAPAGDAARRALEAYGGGSLALVRAAVVWGGLAGARLRLHDYYGDRPRVRVARGELPAAAARLQRAEGA